MSFPEGNYVLGVDLGGSNVRAGVFDGADRAVAERSEPTARDTAASVVAQLAGLGRRLAQDAGVDWGAIDAVGVGVPGVVTGGRLRLAPNLPPFGDVDLGLVLADELGAHVVVDNDVNIATLGEHLAGHGEGVHDFLFIAVGTGVGMGIVAGGRLLRGAHGAAGELGTVPVELPGGHTTLEDVAGGVGVARRYAERAGRAGALTAAAVYAAAEAGDTTAAAVLEEQVDAVALAATAVQSVLDPELIVLGGGIGSRNDFVARVRERIRHLGGRPVRLKPSALGEAAGVIGAAHAARLHLREQIDV